MSEKRKDKRGRILRNGECQRKDGLYQYEYVDPTGATKFLYSWKLEPTDTLPKGKRRCLSLREKEREIHRCIEDGIIPNGGNLTVCELVKRYTLQKHGVRESTKSGYRTVINLLSKDPFGAKRIDKVRLSDAKGWLISLQKNGRGYSSIHTIRGVLRPAFQMAVDDDLIRKNPFAFELATIIVNDSKPREAITQKQKIDFLEFIRTDKHFRKYYDAIYILFYTGLRISEFCGLTVGDIDFEEKTLSVTRQLHRTSDMRYIIEPPKTQAGTRVIPLQDEVCDCFRRILGKRRNSRNEPAITDHNGKLYVGFLYQDKNGMPMVALHWEKYFQRICKKYNSIHKKKKLKVTPHVCRHTYCSHCASAGMNPKHLQYLMGHSDIGVTLNTYTHAEFENIKHEVENLKKSAL